MTRVCLLGSEEHDLRFELLSRETSREALSTYDLNQPFANAVGLETVSLGAAVSLLNDLNWYVVRFADDAFVLDSSVSETEWLSRSLAEAVRADEVLPEETAEYCTIYGLEREAPSDPGTLVEPLYARRTDDGLPEYDLRDVDETVVVRVAESEFDA
ncbi:DUF5804 family protein [Salinarchaeum chitinilyticum]